MARISVSVCDFCERKVEHSEGSLSIPPDWMKLDLSVKTNTKRNEFEFYICGECHSKAIDSSPRGLLRRVLRKIRL